MNEGELNNVATPAGKPFTWERVLQMSRDIMYVLDADGIVLDGNQSFFGTLKRDRSEIVGKPLADFVAPDDQTVCRRVLELMKTRRRSERTTRTFKTATGQAVVFEVVETPNVEAGNLVTVFGVGRDITQEVVLEQKLWDTEEDRRSTLEFALRTSLGLVKGYVYTLEGGDKISAEQRKRYTHVVLEEIDNLAKIIDDLLDYRRLEENSLTVETQVTDLRECVEMVTKQFQEELERRDITLKVVVPEDIQPIYLPPDALMRILLNLIQNSIHHTMHSGEIKIEIADTDDLVDVSVTDNGMGIQEKDLPHVFEKYYRGGIASAAAQGAGLGLAVSRILVNALGGKIEASSDPGKATTFRFVLPRRVGAETAAGTTAVSADELIRFADTNEQ